MILTVAERIKLLSLLPTAGDYATLKILHQLRMSMSLTEDEFKKWGIVNDPEKQMVFFEENGEAEIPIGEKATGIIVDKLRELDKQGELDIEAVSVYEKFIPPPPLSSYSIVGMNFS